MMGKSWVQWSPVISDLLVSSIWKMEYEVGQQAVQEDINDIHSMSHA